MATARRVTETVTKCIELSLTPAEASLVKSLVDSCHLKGGPFRPHPKLSGGIYDALSTVNVYIDNYLFYSGIFPVITLAAEDQKGDI